MLFFAQRVCLCASIECIQKLNKFPDIYSQPIRMSELWNIVVKSSLICTQPPGYCTLISNLNQHSPARMSACVPWGFTYPWLYPEIGVLIDANHPHWVLQFVGYQFPDPPLDQNRNPEPVFVQFLDAPSGCYPSLGDSCDKGQNSPLCDRGTLWSQEHKGTQGQEM